MNHASYYGAQHTMQSYAGICLLLSLLSHLLCHGIVRATCSHHRVIKITVTSNHCESLSKACPPPSNPLLSRFAPPLYAQPPMATTSATNANSYPCCLPCSTLPAACMLPPLRSCCEQISIETHCPCCLLCCNLRHAGLPRSTWHLPPCAEGCSASLMLLGPYLAVPGAVTCCPCCGFFKYFAAPAALSCCSCCGFFKCSILLFLGAIACCFKCSILLLLLR